MTSTPCTPSVATGVEPSGRARCVRRRYRTDVMLPSACEPQANEPSATRVMAENVAHHQNLAVDGREEPLVGLVIFAQWFFHENRCLFSNAC